MRAAGTEHAEPVAQPAAVDPDQAAAGDGAVGVHDLPPPRVQSDGQGQKIAVPVASQVVGAPVHQVGQLEQEARAGSTGSRSSTGRQNKDGDGHADGRTRGCLLQAEHQHRVGEGVQQRVHLPQEQRDEEDHGGVRQLLKVERQEDAGEQPGQDGDRMTRSHVRQSDRPDQSGHGADHAGHAALERLASVGRTGEGDERGDDGPVVPLRGDGLADDDGQRGRQRGLHRLTGRQLQPGG